MCQRGKPIGDDVDIRTESAGEVHDEQQTTDEPGNQYGNNPDVHSPCLLADIFGELIGPDIPNNLSPARYWDHRVEYVAANLSPGIDHRCVATHHFASGMILGDGDTYVALVKRGGGVGDNGIQRFVIIPGANAGKRLRNALGDGANS